MSRPLAVTLILSFVAHTWVAWRWPWPAPVASVGEGLIEVTPTASSVRPSRKAIATGRRATSPAEPPEEKAEEQAPAVAAVSGSGEGPERAERTLTYGELGALGNDLPTYPPEALARGWEGEALLKLRTGADGKVSDRQLLRSSGYDVLDRAALEAAQRWRLPEAGARYRIPVVFRLE